MAAPATYRPRSARVTAGTMIALAAVAAVAHVATEGVHAALPTLGLAVLASVVAVTAYWLPHVGIDSETVTVANVLSTVNVPLARVVHVDTRWALEFQLDDGRKVSAFAAPAPGVVRARNFRVEETHHLPEDTYAAGGVRVGDSPGSPSGAAALLVRTALGEWRARGITDGRSVTRKANSASIGALATGLAAAVAGFLL